MSYAARACGASSQSAALTMYAEAALMRCVGDALADDRHSHSCVRRAESGVPSQRSASISTNS